MSEEKKFECIVVEINGEMVGSVLFYFLNMDVYGGLLKLFLWVEICLLVVVLLYCWKGVVNVFFEVCEKEFWELGCFYLGLYIDYLMEYVIKLYIKRGYVCFFDNDFYLVKDLYVMVFRKLV